MNYRIRGMAGDHFVALFARGAYTVMVESGCEIRYESHGNIYSISFGVNPSAAIRNAGRDIMRCALAFFEALHPDARIDVQYRASEPYLRIPSQYDRDAAIASANSHTYEASGRVVNAKTWRMIDWEFVYDELHANGWRLHNYIGCLEREATSVLDCLLP